MTHHLAQVNIARLLAPIDDPRLADFVAQLDSINALAEQSPGFVWRLKTEAGNATDVVFNDDPFVIVNMSVWESVESLRDYTYSSKHIEVFRRRAEWFEKPAKPTYCLWWAPVGAYADGSGSAPTPGALSSAWRDAVRVLVFADVSRAGVD